MARFEMRVEMDNAAFEDNGELSRILREVADKVDKLRTYPFSLRDINGKDKPRVLGRGPRKQARENLRMLRTKGLPGYRYIMQRVNKEQ